MNAPELHGKVVDIHMFLDSNHAGDNVSTGQELDS